MPRIKKSDTEARLKREIYLTDQSLIQAQQRIADLANGSEIVTSMAEKVREIRGLALSQDQIDEKLADMRRDALMDRDNLIEKRDTLVLRLSALEKASD